MSIYVPSLYVLKNSEIIFAEPDMIKTNPKFLKNLNPL